MTLEDLGNLGEFVGAIGVVASLLYLAFQIRQNTTQMEQNTRSTEFATLNALVQDAQQFRLLVAQDAECMRIYREGLRDFESLNEEERWRFGALMQYLFNNFLMHWRSIHLDLTPPLDVSIATSAILMVLHRPGARRWWREGGESFPAAFQQYIEGLMSEMTTRDRSEPTA